MNWVIDPPPVVALPVDGTDAAFPVIRVFCVGRNYAEHAVEMWHDPDREPPFLFMKPAVAVVPNGGRLPFPPATDDLHHEVELVVGVGSADFDDLPELSRRAAYDLGQLTDQDERHPMRALTDGACAWDLFAS